MRIFLRSVKDIPTADIVSLLDFFTQPRAENKKPLAKLVQKELKAKKNATSMSEIEAIDQMCKRFLCVSVKFL